MRHPLAAGIGLIAQFILLPLATLGATLVLDLSPAIEAAMLLVLALPMTAALLTTRFAPRIAARLAKPLETFALFALLVCVAGAVAGQSNNFVLALSKILPLVVAHNALGLALGWDASTPAHLNEADRRAFTTASPRW